MNACGEETNQPRKHSARQMPLTDPDSEAPRTSSGFTVIISIGISAPFSPSDEANFCFFPFFFALELFALEADTQLFRSFSVQSAHAVGLLIVTD